MRLSKSKIYRSKEPLKIGLSELTEQEKLEIKSIEGKGIDYIVRSSLNEVLPLIKISDRHLARIRES